MKPSLSIIIPAFQEEASIASVLDELQQILAFHQWDFPIILVDDGSTDKTAEIARSKGITVLRHEENRGYGASLKTGIRHADTEFILITDADGTYPAQYIPELVKHIEIYDMVVGARNRVEATRAAAKWVLNKLANYLSETKIPDLNSGMRIIRKSLVEQYWSILPNGFSFTTTITLASLCNGYAVKYVTIDYRDRTGKSKIQPIRNTWQFFLLIIRTVVYFNPLKVFAPVGLFFVLFGIIIGFYSKFALGKIMDVTTITSVTTGMEILMIGFLADLIARRTK